MNILAADNLTKSYGEKPLFSDLSISLAKGQKVALIAANGSGKSTLLRIIAGQESADEGTVVFRRDTKVGYLEQNPELDESVSLIDAVLDRNHPIMAAINKYELLISKSDTDQDELQSVISEIDNLNAWNYESRISEILSRLGLTDLEQPVSTLSGGQRKRCALARILIEDHDVLILDEPTNHLDLEMIEWVEKYIKKLNVSVLLVSHDRYFIDGICNTILELDNGNLYKYQGNYSFFLEKRSERLESEQLEIKKYKNLFRKELEWMRRQPKARGTKQKARVNAFDDIEEKAFAGKIDKSSKISMQMERMGSKILELENVCKSYDQQTLLHNFSHVFKKGEKIGIVGKNGIGKSTLLKLITGDVKPDKGKIKIGETINVGYFSQDGISFDPDKLVIDIIRDIADYVDTGNSSSLSAKQFLNHFNFDGHKQYQKVASLSGGEKKRLYLLSILVQKPNFLILDEPTNDLDIVTLNLFEEFLSNFQGCILLVTHDRYFMDRLVDHIFVFKGDGVIRDIHGNYTDYLSEEKVKSGKTISTKNIKQENSDKKAVKKKGLGFKEKRELEQTLKDISILEIRKNELLEKMNQGIIDHNEMNTISEKFKKTDDDLIRLTERWMELEAKSEES